jgi:biopolymer transport protein TolQ
LDSPLAQPGDLVGFLSNADGVVRFVVVLLLLCSLASWAIIIEKAVRVRMLGRNARAAEDWARRPEWLSDAPDGLPAAMLAAVRLELRLAGDDLRSRVEAALRAVYLADMRAKATPGLSFLATVASTAPFLGLFGTVWGIMRSFSAIGEVRDASLSAVAPGIAEALFATAIGLFAAIPALIAYNRLTHGLDRLEARLGRFADRFHSTLSRELEQEG